ncbi:MAG TPA: 6-bladed beta-propeller, partial [Nitrosopumilaceae archaeon]|nr:6-bladed beta-propeller [Nitrosopumilaceae archaeon]
MKKILFLVIFAIFVTVIISSHQDVWAISVPTFLFKFGSAGTGIGQFNNPDGIAVDSLHRIIVADTNNNRIQVFSSAGNPLFQFGTSGSGIGQFTSPQGVAVDSLGNIYVADTNNNRIQVFDS